MLPNRSAGASGPVTPLAEPPSGAAGMAVVRVPAGEVEAYAALAATDDQSVVRGLLAVVVTRWAVALH